MGNQMRYQLTLIMSGSVWFVIAGLVGHAVPVFGNLWFPHLIVAVITGLAVGNIIRPLLSRYFGTRKWFLLPLLSLFLGSAIFGILVPVSWQVVAWLKDGSVSLKGNVFYMLPALMVFYSMTIYLITFYPLALLNNWIIYRFTRSE